MKRMLLCLLLLAVPAAAQDPAPQESPPAESPPSVEKALEAVAAGEVTPEEAASAPVIEEKVEETLEQVAAGEVTPAEGARDRAAAPDMGANAILGLLLIVAGRFLLPPVRALVHRIPWLENEYAGQVNAIVCVALYVGLGFGLLRQTSDALPQDWVSWIWLGFGAAGFTQATSASKADRTGG